MLKALGLTGIGGGSKSKNTVDDDSSRDPIKKHKEQRRLCNLWLKEVEKLASISTDLQVEYGKHKSDFAFNRYDKLKFMCKAAIQQYGHVMQGHQNRPPEVVIRLEPEEVPRPKLGAISRLRESARSFAENQGHLSLSDAQYSQMTSRQLQQETEEFKKEIIHLKHVFRIRRDNMEKFVKRYEDSKKYNPAQRYPVLKEMIKMITTQQVR